MCKDGNAALWLLPPPLQVARLQAVKQTLRDVSITKIDTACADILSVRRHPPRLPCLAHLPGASGLHPLIRIPLCCRARLPRVVSPLLQRCHELVVETKDEKREAKVSHSCAGIKVGIWANLNLKSGR